MTDHFDAADARAVIREGTLDADAVGHTTDGKGLADAAALHLDDDAFKVLQSFTVAFDDLHENANGIADFQLGQVASELFFFEFTNDVGHV